MLTLDEIKELLQDRNIQKVANNAGVHPNVLYRIKNGASNPSYETVKKISDYLEGQ